MAYYDCLTAQEIVVHPWSELFVVSLFWIAAVSFYRITFSKVIGEWIGKRYSNRLYGKVEIPSFIAKDENKRWKLNVLKEFCEAKKNQPNSTAKQKYTAKVTLLRNKHGFEGAPNEIIKLDNCVSNKVFRRFQIKEKSKNELKSLCDQLGLSKSEMKQYWRYNWRRNQYIFQQNNYSEQLWKCITLCFITFYGIYTIYDQPFLYDSTILFEEYPQREINKIMYYYAIAIGYHGHRTLMQFFDYKRKDFWALLVHHWVTLALILLSWHFGLTQHGCLVLFCHDNADAMLMLAKVCDFEQWNTVKEIIFALFAICWMCSRVGLFSWKVIYPLFTPAFIPYGCHPYYWLFIPLLLSLLALHFYWSWMIIKMVIKRCKGGELVDERSDDEEDEWGKLQNVQNSKEEVTTLSNLSNSKTL